MLSPIVTCRSCIASSKALCTLAGARLISSANTKTLLKIIENSNKSNANDILKQVTVNKTKEDIETGKTYKVTANYNTNGFINEIIITEELTNVVPQV